MTVVKARWRRTRGAQVSDCASGVVKSAGRVLEILEFFDDIQMEANVVEISTALNYPQSSTSALLRSLVKLGYLHHNPFKRTYISSNRVALLGHWVSPEVCQSGPLLELMKGITGACGDSTILATRRGLFAQYVHVVQATLPARLHITSGSLRPLAASGTGLVLLSTLRDQEIIKIVNRINAETAEEEQKVRLRDIMDVVNSTRAKGYSLCCNLVTPGGAILAAVLDNTGDENTTVLAIGGISEIMQRREEELAELLLDRIRLYKEQRRGPPHLTLVSSSEIPPAA